MKWPTKSQWRQFFKILSPKEKAIFFVFLSLFVGSGLFLSINFYFKNTIPKPAEGGSYIEGVVGFPRWINPVYAPANEADQDLTELLFSGLMKYDSKGSLRLDLAKKYEILENGKVWKFYLKENILWSDGQALTADDIVFTIETIQNPEIKSPWRANWLGVEAEKISELGVRFSLKNESSIFLENCTVKIIPKHIWKNVLPQNFPLSAYNLRPVGSGPYQLKNLLQNQEGKIISLTLGRNPHYFGQTTPTHHPYISQISFRFFDEETELISAFKNGEIKGFSLKDPKNLPKLSNFTNLYSLSLPRYFAIFFNPRQSKPLAEKEVRQALNYGTNKQDLIDKVLLERGETVDSPILPEIYGFKTPSKIYQFDPVLAEEILEKAGFVKIETDFREKTIKKTPTFQFKSNLRFGSRGSEVKELQKCLAKDPEIYPEGEVTGYFGNLTKKAVIKFQEKYRAEILEPFDLEKGTGEVKKLTRNKLNEICFEQPEEKIPLKFSLVTVNQPILVEVASLLKAHWQALGAEVEVKTFEISTLEREIIKPRSYQALLFGEVLGAIPDPFPFWHSSQKKDPGLNLASYENKECDKLLEEARQSLDEEERREKLVKFQDLLIEDAPAIFLYSPDYLYLVSKEIKGIEVETIVDPSKRFANIEEWYIKTRRVWR